MRSISHVTCLCLLAPWAHLILLGVSMSDRLAEICFAPWCGLGSCVCYATVNLPDLTPGMRVHAQTLCRVH